MELKSLHKDAIPGALAKAERYRLLHEPRQSESICQDVLRIDPENEEALITLILAVTDQFDKGVRVEEAKTLISRLSTEYDRAYYSGIISERLQFRTAGRTDSRSRRTAVLRDEELR